MEIINIGATGLGVDMHYNKQQVIDIVFIATVSKRRGCFEWQQTCFLFSGTDITYLPEIKAIFIQYWSNSIIDDMEIINIGATGLGVDYSFHCHGKQTARLL
jgi:hypothetical protein